MEKSWKEPNQNTPNHPSDDNPLPQNLICLDSPQKPPKPPVSNSPPLPKMSSHANDNIGLFKDIDVKSSPSVENASLYPFCALGDFMTISALAGIGKTHVGVDILVGAGHPGRKGLSLGGVFQFSLPQSKPLKCAIIDAESTQVRISAMIRRKLDLEGLDPEQLGIIRYLRSSDFGIHNVGAREENSRGLAESLAHDRCQFVLIDTLAAAWAPSNINDPEWVFRGLKPFREICQKYGITVIGLTHTSRKAANENASFNPIGSSHQENLADVQLSIIRDPRKGPDGIQITHRKSRRSFWIRQGSKVGLEFTPELGYKPSTNWSDLWAHDWSGEASSNFIDEQSPRFRVESAVKAASPGAIPSKDISNELGVPSRTVRKALQDLEGDGIVERRGGGRSAKWRSTK